MYERILQEIQTAAANRGFQFQPAQFLTDFETGLMAAITVQLPGTQQRGCRHPQLLEVGILLNSLKLLVSDLLVYLQVDER